jgi:hypothetical protein
MATDNIFAGSITCTGLTATGAVSFTGAVTFTGPCTITGLRTIGNSSAVITAARVLTALDSGGVFLVTPPAGSGVPYAITLPTPPGPGLHYTFFMNTAGGSNVTFISAVGGANSFIGTIQIDGATIPCPVGGSTTLTAVAGSSVLGDCIEVFSISSTVYGVRAIASTAGGITIS